MKKLILFFLLLPVLLKGQINLSNSTLSANNGTCTGASISVNGNYLLDGSVNGRNQYSMALNLQAPDYQLCYDQTVYSVPTNKLSMRWSGRWQLGFISNNSFVAISSIPFGSPLNGIAAPNCDASMFSGTVKGTPTIAGTNCLSNVLTASAYGATAFQWYKDQTAIAGATNSAYTPTEPGNYQVATVSEKGYWLPLAGPSTNQMLNDVYFINNRTGWIVSNSGGIFKTTSGGDSWATQSSGTTANLSAAYFTDANNGVVVGANGIILRTVNGGTNWQNVATGVTNNLTDVFFLNSTIGWAVGSKYIVLKTTDGGASWNTVSIDNSASVNDVYVDVQFVDATTGYVTGNNTAASTSFVRKSTNGGSAWTVSQSAGQHVIRKLSFISNDIGWTGGRSTNPSPELPLITKTVNGGTNWSTLSIPTSFFDRSITSLQFTDANRGWAILPNSLNTTILTTTDGGSTFTVMSKFILHLRSLLDHVFLCFPMPPMVGSSGWILPAAINS